MFSALCFRHKGNFLLLMCLFIFLCLLSKLSKKSKVYPTHPVDQDVPPPTGGAKYPIKLINKFVERSHAGEGGAAFPKGKDDLSGKDLEEFLAGEEMNSFNLYASDRISLRRSLPDNRLRSCKKISYPVEVMPSASVVICFHNEALSTLLRTIYSVVDRTPYLLLREVILVDDGSTLDFLKNPLQEYVEATFGGLVKIVRTKVRVGLIRARLVGANAAMGEVLLFLDSHCEATEGWIEPLLYLIHKDEATVVAPNIKKINYNNMAFNPSPRVLLVGGFTWTMDFTWRYPTKNDLKSQKTDSDPIFSPTIAGGLFAVSRKYFFDLGSYDPGMDIWGAENLEISFRTWMCHGQVFIHPCSMVGHIFRRRSPYKWRRGKDVITINTLRLANVWLDDYKNYFFKVLGRRINTDYGNITERLELRNRLRCKSFHWYLETVLPSMFIPDMSEIVTEIRNLHFGVCLQFEGDYDPVKISKCHLSGGNQMWFYTENLEIRREDSCLSVGYISIAMGECHSAKANQIFKVSDAGLIHVGTAEVKCLAISEDGKSLVADYCSTAPRFYWKLTV